MIDLEGNPAVRLAQIRSTLSRRRSQVGASTVEYLVATIVVVAMLFLPIPGYGESVVEMMVQGFKDSHHHYVWGMSYPL